MLFLWLLATVSLNMVMVTDALTPSLAVCQRQLTQWSVASW